MDEDADRSQRQATRSRVLLTAVVIGDAGSMDVRVRNLSPYGALLEAKNAPVTGSAVTFIREEVSVGATVAWVSGKQFGLEFAERVDLEEVLVPIASGTPQPPPPPNDFKRPGFNSKVSMQEMWLAAQWREAAERDRPGE